MEPMKDNKMGTMPVGKLLVNMALPMIISMLVQALYNTVDSIYVSQVSESAVTALGLAFPVQNLQIGFGVGIGVGVNALLSQSPGPQGPGECQLGRRQRRIPDADRHGAVYALRHFRCPALLRDAVLRSRDCGGRHCLYQHLLHLHSRCVRPDPLRAAASGHGPGLPDHRSSRAPVPSSTLFWTRCLSTAGGACPRWALPARRWPPCWARP